MSFWKSMKNTARPYNRLPYKNNPAWNSAGREILKGLSLGRERKGSTLVTELL